MRKRTWQELEYGDEWAKIELGSRPNAREKVEQNSQKPQEPTERTIKLIRKDMAKAIDAYHEMAWVGWADTEHNSQKQLQPQFIYPEPLPQSRFRRFLSMLKGYLGSKLKGYPANIWTQVRSPLNLAALMCVNYGLIAVSIRMLQKGSYVGLGIADGAVACWGFMLIKQVVKAETVWEQIGYTIGGIAGSLVGLWVTK